MTEFSRCTIWTQKYNSFITLIIPPFQNRTLTAAIPLSSHKLLIFLPQFPPSPLNHFIFLSIFSSLLLFHVCARNECSMCQIHTITVLLTSVRHLFMQSEYFSLWLSATDVPFGSFISLFVQSKTVSVYTLNFSFSSNLRNAEWSALSLTSHWGRSQEQLRYCLSRADTPGSHIRNAKWKKKCFPREGKKKKKVTQQGKI